MKWPPTNLYNVQPQKRAICSVAAVTWGRAYLGLVFLEREKKIFLENPNVRPDLEGEKYVIGRMLKPEASKKTIEFFEEQKSLPDGHDGYQRRPELGNPAYLQTK